MKKMKISILVLLCFFAITSCKKKGCTETKADNFNSEAKKDDGSCSYSGNTVIWFNTSKVIDFSASGTTNLFFYLEGEQIGALTLLDFVNTAPACGGAHAVTVQRDLGGSPSKNFILTVKGDAGTVLDTYTLPINGGICTKFLLN